MKRVLFILIFLVACSEEDPWSSALWVDGGEDSSTDTESYTDSDTDTDTDTTTDTDTETETNTGSDTDSDTDSDIDSDTDTDTDTDTDADSDTDSDTATGPDTDTDGDCIGPGVYFDTVTGRCWERNAPTTIIDYASAQAHCDSLTLDGATDWRLPTITELQTISECAPSTGCGVHDPACLSLSCEDTCSTCPLMEGPASNGCYWDDAVFSGECSLYWSSSQVVGLSNAKWLYYFSSGNYVGLATSAFGYARCVRM